MPLPSRKTVPDGISRRVIMNEERIGSIMETRDLSGFSVLDCDNRKIGTADEVWEDHTGQPAFLSVKTGWLGLGRSHFIPLYEAEVSPSSRAIRLPYDEETVKNSPDFESETDIDAGRESALFEYYRARGKGMPEQPARDWGPGSRSMEAEARPDEAASVELKEETLNVGKHEVESGGVRLRKVIKKETVDQPVELAHEEIEIERVRPSDAGGPRETDFKEDEVFIPLRREVADVSKSARVTEEIHARKKTETERQDVTEELRKEDIEIER
jgi:uncharacterized protein (TIGR02271 family)